MFEQQLHRADSVASWLLSDGEIEICLREDGKRWLLGAGAYGKVSSPIAPAPPALSYLPVGLSWQHLCHSRGLQSTPSSLLLASGPCLTVTSCMQVYRGVRGGVQASSRRHGFDPCRINCALRILGLAYQALLHSIPLPRVLCCPNLQPTVP